MTGRTRVVLAWAMTRLGMLVLLGGLERSTAFDVKYYFMNMAQLYSSGSGRKVIPEYPLPSALLMFPEYLVTRAHRTSYELIFGLAMLCVDGLIAVSLWRLAGRRATPPVWFWIVFLPLLGPMIYYRYDLVPAALVLLGVVWLTRAPERAGIAIAAAAAVKLWPALLLPAFLRDPRARRSFLVPFFVVGALATIGTALVGGIARTWSPLTNQRDRGLQIESLVATPLALARRAGHGGYHVGLEHYAYEINGPGVPAALAISSALVIVAAVLMAWLWWRAYALEEIRPPALVWLVLSTVLLFIVSDKTFSPQYLTWAAVVVAPLLVLDRGAGSRRTAWLLLAAGLLSHLVFPGFYAGILAGNDPLGLGVLCLLLRNLLMIAVTYVAVRESVSQTSAAHRKAASTTA